jgi:hypothetical protein
MLLSRYEATNRGLQQTASRQPDSQHRDRMRSGSRRGTNRCRRQDHEVAPVTTVFANIDDKLVQEFRSVIFKKCGLKKGDISKAIEEALQDYVKKYSK